MITGHPLKVYFPHGGKHFIAVWWTHDEQNQIVVAKSMPALEKTLNIAISKNSDFEIKEILEVDIVSPPDELCEVAKKEARKRLVNEFFQTITYYIDDMIENKIQIPEIFKICDKWKSTRKDTNKKNDPNHYECGNCFRKISLKNLSVEEFYEKYHLGWDNLLKVPFNKKFEISDDGDFFSRAKNANSKMELWSACPHFGHHCKGVELRFVDQNPNDEYINTNSVLFYFHKIKEINNSKYQEIIKNIKDKEIKKEKLSKEQFQKNRQKENEEKFQKIKDFFVL